MLADNQKSMNWNSKDFLFCDHLYIVNFSIFSIFFRNLLIFSRFVFRFSFLNFFCDFFALHQNIRDIIEKLTKFKSL